MKPPTDAQKRDVKKFKSNASIKLLRIEKIDSVKGNKTINKGDKPSNFLQATAEKS